MARLQILELPEVFIGEASETPFVLVVDQYEPPSPYPSDVNEPGPYDGIAEKIGARAVLAFETTVDIPANDIAVPTDAAFKSEVQQWAAGTSETLANLIDAVSGKKRRPANDGQRLADERTDIARDMDRLAKRKNELLDALGMDRTRDWDDIRNAAAGLRRERDAQAVKLEQLHAGEEPATDNRVRPTPAQWIWQWNRATPEKRLDMAAQILDGMGRANTCFMADHEAQIARLRAELDLLHLARTDAEEITRQTPHGPRPGRMTEPPRPTDA